MATAVGATEAQAAAPPTSPAAAALVARVDALYGGAQRVEADFDASLEGPRGQRDGSGPGHVESGPGGSMRWSYKQPPVRRGMFAPPTVPSHAFAFMRGSLSSAYDFKHQDGAKLGAPGTDLLVGTPKAPGTIARALFYVDSASAEVRRVVLVDALGARARVDFTNTRIQP